MNLMKILATNSYCYKEMPNMSKVLGIMVHSTGCNNPNLRRYVGPDNGKIGKPSSSHWNQYKINGEVHKVMVHAFIGKLLDGSVGTVQVQEWNKKCYHCGSGKTGKSGNTNYISFEICEDNLQSKDYFNKVYKEATELCAMLCKEFNLDPLKNIVCHSEGYKKGFASNHADVMHWFPKYGKSMDTFRKDVYNLMKEEEDIMSDMNHEKFAQYMDKWLADRAKMDGSSSKEFKDAQNKAIEKGLVAGDGTGNMMWKSYLTREQFVLIMNRAGLLK